MSKTILIVDDEPRMARPVERVLRHHGYNPITSPTTHAAREHIQRNLPDLIILDIMFPESDRAGIDFLAELKGENSSARDTPVIMLTVRGESEVERECRQLGAEKPPHLAAGDDRRILGEGDIDRVGVRRRLNRKRRLAASSRVWARLMFVADMVAMQVANQDYVDLAEAWIIGARHRAPGVIEDAGAVWVFEHHRPVESAEFSVMAAERRDFHPGRGGALHGHAEDGGGKCRRGQKDFTHRYSSRSIIGPWIRTHGPRRFIRSVFQVEGSIFRDNRKRFP